MFLVWLLSFHKLYNNKKPFQASLKCEILRSFQKISRLKTDFSTTEGIHIKGAYVAFCVKFVFSQYLGKSLHVDLF